MTDEELQEAADDLAARRNDPRTPAIVRRAFLGRAMTLRTYLALEDAASPVLSGDWPVDRPEAMAEAFCTAWATVFPGRSIPDAEGLQDAMAELQAAVRRSFSTVMPMRFPKVRGAAERTEAPDGLGWVARTVGRFVALGWRPEDVLDLPMDQLFILNAALAANEGADCAGEDYRERETGERRAETGDQRPEAQPFIVYYEPAPGREWKTWLCQARDEDSALRRFRDAVPQAGRAYATSAVSAVGAVDEGQHAKDPERGANDAQGDDRRPQEIP